MPGMEDAVFKRKGVIPLALVVMGVAAALCVSPAARLDSPRGPEEGSATYESDDSSFIVEPGSPLDTALLQEAAAGGAVTSDERGMPEVPGPDMLAPPEVRVSGSQGASEQAAAPPGDAPAPPVLIRSFEGPPDSGTTVPPNPSIAAGKADLVVTADNRVRLYSKKGSLLLARTLRAWFADVLPAPPFALSIGNGWALFDSVHRRFVVAAQATNRSAGFSRFLVSVSDDAVAEGRWCNWSLDARPNNGTDTGNYAYELRMGMNANTVILAANMADFAEDRFRYAKVRFVPKSGLYFKKGAACPGKFSAFDVWDLWNADGTRARTVVPAHSNVGPANASSATAYLVNSRHAGGDYLTVWRATTQRRYPPNPILVREATDTVLAYQMPPDATQPGTTVRIETGNTQLQNAVHRPGRLFVALTIGGSEYPWPAGVFYLRTSSFGGPVGVTPHFAPGIAASGTGERLVGAGSAAYDTRFPSPRFPSSQYFAYTERALAGIDELRRGEGCYVRLNRGRQNAWSTRSGAALDPVTGHFWIISQYARGASSDCTENGWGLRIGEIAF